jgi:hypothetical protein
MKVEKPARWLVLGLSFIFVLAFIPRISQSTARVMLWYGRANSFWRALESGELADTYQQYHPGVTTMWVSGLGTRLYQIVNDKSDDQISLTDNTDPGQPEARAGQIAMAIVLSGAIVLIVFLLSKTMGWLVAFAGGVFLALDPFYITHSKLIHVDAFLATFMLVSAISWFTFLKSKRWRYLVLSAVFGGLAFLTKSPSIYLIPIVVLTLLLQAFKDERRLFEAPLDRRSIMSATLHLVAPFMAWLALAVVVFFILWPALWVDPMTSLSEVFGAARLHSVQPHPSPQFFAGRIVDGDPGILFYVATLAWRTTTVTLLAIILAVYLLFKKSRSGEDTRLWWYLLLYAAGFFLMMTLSAKKGGRYILPVFLALDLLAAWAVVRAAAWMASRPQMPALRRRVPLLMAFVLLLQAALVFRYRPYYGTHFNLLLGGSRVAQRILPLGLEGEGLDIAVDVLNSLPDAQRLGVQMRFSGTLIFRTRFAGQINPENPDYLLVFINFLQRGLYDQSILRRWEACQERGEAQIISFDGVPYVWMCPLYSRDPDDHDIAQRRRVLLGEHVEMLGYGLSPTEVAPGEAVNVQLFWQSDGAVAADYHVFVHVTNQSGELVAQSDGVPAGGDRPTWSWLKDEIIQDLRSLTIPAELPEGLYSVAVGLYDYGTLARLPAFEPAGARLADDRIELGTVFVSGSGATSRAGGLQRAVSPTPVEAGPSSASADITASATVSLP